MKFSHMRIWQGLAIAAMICAFSSVALANDFAVNWNDPTPSSPLPYYDVTSAGTPFSFTLSSPSDCPALLSVTAPGGCAVFLNDTGSTVTSFDLQFTVPAGSALLTQNSIDCSAGSAIFPVDNCGNYTSFSVGELVTLNFSGGSIPYGNDLYLIIEGASPGDFGPLTGTVGVPEPSSILLLIAGLGFLALFGAWQKRAKDRIPMPVRARMG